MSGEGNGGSREEQQCFGDSGKTVLWEGDLTLV